MKNELALLFLLQNKISFLYAFPIRYTFSSLTRHTEPAPTSRLEILISRALRRRPHRSRRARINQADELREIPRHLAIKPHSTEARYNSGINIFTRHKVKGCAASAEQRGRVIRAACELYAL